MPTLLALAALLALSGCLGHAQPVPQATWAEIAAIDPATYLTPPPCGDQARALDGTCGDPFTVYAAPGASTYVVDGRRGRDDGPGTAERPWRTIGRAAARGVLRPGDAVVVREGVYRESVRPQSGGAPGRLVTFAAHPGERVVISGADPAPDGWERIGDAWRRAWTWEPMEAYSDDPVFRRELVVASGTPLPMVATRAELRPGTFWMEGPDTAPRAVWLRLPEGRSPATAGVEVGVRDVLFGPLGPDPYVECADASQPGYLRIVGFELRHAANRAQVGALCAGHAGSLVEDVAAVWTNGVGVDASGDGHTFRRVRADHHGQMGWMGHGTGVTIEDGTAVGNNWKGYDLFWEAGGGKWDRTTDLVIRRHTAAWNDGPGIWLDGDTHRNTIEDSRLRSNAMAGIMLELDTRHTLVQHNVVTGTRWRAWSGSGLLSQAASHNVIVHNTFADNEGSGVWLRLDPEQRAPDGWTTLVRNVIVGNARAPEVEARELAVEAESAERFQTYRIDGNVYGRVADRDPTMRSAFFGYAPGRERGESVEVRSDALGGWQRETGFDRRSVQTDRADPVPRLRALPGVPAAGAARAPVRLTDTPGTRR